MFRCLELLVVYHLYWAIGYTRHLEIDWYPLFSCILVDYTFQEMRLYDEGFWPSFITALGSLGITDYRKLIIYFSCLDLKSEAVLVHTLLKAAKWLYSRCFDLGSLMKELMLQSCMFPVPNLTISMSIESCIQNAEYVPYAGSCWAGTIAECVSLVLGLKNWITSQLDKTNVGFSGLRTKMMLWL